MILPVSVLCLYFQMSKSNENLHLNSPAGSDHWAPAVERGLETKQRRSSSPAELQVWMWPALQLAGSQHWYFIHMKHQGPDSSLRAIQVGNCCALKPVQFCEKQTELLEHHPAQWSDKLYNINKSSNSLVNENLMTKPPKAWQLR